MFKLFKSFGFGKATQKKVELISIHIPKTAGTSFRNILKGVYGKDAVIRLDISLKTKKLRINEQLYTATHLPPKTQVIHGHFSPSLIKQRFDLDPVTPMITWLRHPVERVISNFFYLEKRLQEELQEEAKGLDILRKMQRNLMEYARDEINQNRQAKFLQGVQLSELAFVGIQEHYSEDLIEMAKHFKWPSVKEVKYNVTGRKYDQVSEEHYAEIAALNNLDMKLYEEGLAIRAKRLQI